PEPECNAMASRDTLLRATDVPPPDTSDPVGASLGRSDTGSRAGARLSLLRSSDDISSSADISGARLPVRRPETTPRGSFEGARSSPLQARDLRLHDAVLEPAAGPAGRTFAACEREIIMHGFTPISVGPELDVVFA